MHGQSHRVMVSAVARVLIPMGVAVAVVGIVPRAGSAAGPQARSPSCLASDAGDALALGHRRVAQDAGGALAAPRRVSLAPALDGHGALNHAAAVVDDDDFAPRDLQAQAPGIPALLRWHVEAPAPRRGQLAEPRGVAAGADGALYIVDGAYDRLVVVEPGGDVRDVWGGRGTGEGRLMDAWGVAVAPEGSRHAGRVYVADAGNHRIAMFDPRGRWVGAIGRPGTGRGQLRIPRGVAVSADGSVWVADTGNHRLQRFDAAGTWQGITGRAGSEPGRLRLPQAVVPEASGALWVADTGNHRLQRLSPNGAHLASVGRLGTGAGRMRGPRDLVATASGDVWASDSGNGRLVHVDRAGRWLGAVTMPSSPTATLPSGVALDGRGGLHVADAAGGQLRRLDLDDGRWLDAWGEPSPHATLKPLAIAATDRDLFVADGGRHQVLRLSPDGLRASAVGAPGRGPGRFRFDDGAGLAVTAEGSLLVADPGNGLVHELDRRGTVQRAFPPRASPGAAPIAPHAVAADGEGWVWVAGAGQPYAIAHDGARRPRAIVGGAGRFEGRLATASSVATDGQRRVWIADGPNRRIQAFDRQGYLVRLLGVPAWDVACQHQGTQLWPRAVLVEPEGTLLVHGGWSGGLERWTAAGEVLARWTGPPLARDDTLAVAPDGDLLVGRRATGRIERYGHRPAPGWHVATYANGDLAGWPVAVERVPRLALDWGRGPLADGVPEESGSLRATRWLEASGGRYRLRATALGGLRVWVGPRLLVDGWGETTARALHELSLPPGLHRVEVEYRDVGEAAALALSLERQPGPTPTIVRTRAPTGTPSPPPSRTPQPSATLTVPAYPTAFLTPGAHRLWLPRLASDRAPGAPEPVRRSFEGNAAIDVQRYDIVLRMPELGDAPITAAVTLTMRIVTPTRYVDLDAEPVGIRQLSVWHAGQAMPWSWLPAPPGAQGQSGSRVRVHLAQVQPAGRQVALVLRYRIAAASLRDRLGMAYDPDFLDSRILYTRNAHYYARRWLPSNDHPSDAARFSLDLRVPPGMVAAAVGELAAGDRVAGEGVDAKGLRRFRFRVDWPIPTYLLALAVGELQVQQDTICWNDGLPAPQESACETAQHQRPFVFYIPAGADGQQEAFVRAIARSARNAMGAAVWHARAVGLPSAPVFGFAYLPHPFNMEYPGLTTLTSAAETVAAHEVMHLWWGGDVRLAAWRDFWVKEGLTTYLSTLWNGFAEEPPLCECSQEALAPPGPIDPHAFLRGSSHTVPAYCKGAAVWHDLHRRLATLTAQDFRAREPTALFMDVVARVWRARQGRATTSREMVQAAARAVVPAVRAAGLTAEEAPTSALEELARSWADHWLPPVDSPEAAP